MGETQLTAIDGTDALFGLILKPGEEEGGVVATMFGSGMHPALAAEYLRKIADSLDERVARDAEETP